MNVAKKNLVPLYQLIKGTEGELSLSESRVRDAFMKTLGESVQTFEAEKTKIFETFCVKDEEGKPDTSNDQYKFDKEVQEDLNKELTVLIEEEVDLDFPENFKEIAEKSTYKPKVGETELIDEVLGKL